ncbi:TRAP transporter small permease [Paenisporosarcina antarctica]|uniref:TRAP transporter small permease n=1 Tax=Paenisporosarcina antarctica TaxID=417367 RepID=A0A4P7A1Y6_9BACL|nr:TRAP transporter small permease [Paenisporosarcina antarctica]QBP42624.1 TRAP transporter small permease [Paenisporosarcina antarctica]
MIRKFSQMYVKTENFITNLLMVGVVAFVLFASVVRWAGYPLSWSVEFAQLLFVWVIFLGANRALREDKHISVDFFTKKLSKKTKAILESVIFLLIIAFLFFLMIFGIKLSIENSVRVISNLTVSYSLVTMSVPIGSTLMIITLFFKLKERFKSFKSEVV